jgi:hypothetical protein
VEFDRQIEQVVIAYLDAIRVRYRITAGESSRELSVDASAELPVALRGGVHTLIGSPIPGSLLHPLHLGHPLVIAAVNHAREQGKARTFSVGIRATSPELATLRGQRGRLRLVRIVHRGFETAEHLLPVAVLAGATEPLSVEVGRLLIEAIAEDRQPLPPAVSDEQLDDAVDEIVFHDTGLASSREQPRFERTLQQIECFVTDRILLLERKRDSLVQRLAKDEAARASAIGSEQRDRADQTLRRHQTELEALDAEIARLRAGDDPGYQHWRKHMQKRRYAPPEIEHLLDAEFEIT